MEIQSLNRFCKNMTYENFVHLDKKVMKFAVDVSKKVNGKRIGNPVVISTILDYYKKYNANDIRYKSGNLFPNVKNLKVLLTNSIIDKMIKKYLKNNKLKIEQKHKVLYITTPSNHLDYRIKFFSQTCEFHIYKPKQNHPCIKYKIFVGKKNLETNSKFIPLFDTQDVNEIKALLEPWIKGNVTKEGDSVIIINDNGVYYYKNQVLKHENKYTKLVLIISEIYGDSYDFSAIREINAFTGLPDDVSKIILNYIDRPITDVKKGEFKLLYDILITPELSKMYHDFLIEKKFTNFKDVLHLSNEDLETLFSGNKHKYVLNIIKEYKKDPAKFVRNLRYKFSID
jgi:hypothetical protein